VDARGHRLLAATKQWLQPRQSLHNYHDMNRAFSTYLNLLRIVCAATVFLSHLNNGPIGGQFIEPMAPYGTVAVVFFFVISGFVIGYVTDRKETTLGGYAISRVSRIYPVALPAVALTLALDWLGSSIHPAWYSSSFPFYLGDSSPYKIGLALLFLNESWSIHGGVGTNSPYWSLSYEVWYYVIFGCAWFLRGRLRIITVVLAFGIVGPRIAAMFPAWLLGVAGYYVYSRVGLPYLFGIVVYVTSIICWILYERWAIAAGVRTTVPLPMHGWKLLDDLVIALLFVVHLVAFGAMFRGDRTFGGLTAEPINWVAGRTFSLYLFHVPIIAFLGSVMPWGPQSWTTRVVIACSALACCLVLAAYTECKKEFWRRQLRSISLPSVVHWMRRQQG
jgi:peptidoglycan/LPS O-acetylase OafA/YrhL